MLCTLYKFFEELENPVVDDVNVLSTEFVGKKFCWRIDNSTWIGLLSQIKTDGEKRVWRVDIKQRLSPGFMENGGGWGGDVEGDHPILMNIPAKELKRKEGGGQKAILVGFFYKVVNCVNVCWGAGGGGWGRLG